MMTRKLLTAVVAAMLSVSLQAAPVAKPASKPAEATTAAGKNHDPKAASDLASRFQVMKTLVAEFEQVSSGQDGRVKTESGILRIKRPNQFFWEVKKPYNQQIVARDNKIWQVDPDFAQAVIKFQDKAMGTMPTQLLSGDAEKFLQDFQVIRFSDKDRQTYTLRPAKPSELFEQLTIVFLKGELSTMTLKDSLGGSRRIQLSEVKINKPISDQVFKLDIPKDFDVIDETRS